MFLPLCTTNLLLLYLLLSRSLTCESLREKNESITEETLTEKEIILETFEEPSKDNDFSLPLTTTTESTIVDTNRKLSLPMSEEKNNSTDFRPSFHVGEIKESRISPGPFNNLRHISFHNGIDPTSYQDHLKDYGVVYESTEQSLPDRDFQGNFHQGLYETVAGSSEESKKEATEQNSYVKFEDAVDVPRTHYGTFLQAQPIRFAQTIPENSGAEYGLMDQQVFQNFEKPVHEPETSNVFGKPSKFQSEGKKGGLGGYSISNSLSAPYIGGFHGDQSYSPPASQFQALKNPNNGVVYVEESSFTRTRKFPYPFYQPPVGYHEIEFVRGDQPGYLVRRRVSPWKKILHLIGAFLPLGLLLATLTPNIVKIDNTTQPSIVLSKWRLADLPVEHKQARLVSEESSNNCEERSICRLILAGGRARSSVLQNALWNLATRTSTTIAKENGLQEIFEAVKKKDCLKILC